MPPMREVAPGRPSRPPLNVCHFPAGQVFWGGSAPKMASLPLELWKMGAWTIRAMVAPELEPRQHGSGSSSPSPVPEARSDK